MIYEIEAFYRNGDGDDWLPAVKRAMHEWHPTADTTGDYRGFTLQFGPREYKFSGSIELIRGMSLVGSGGAGWYGGTTLIFPPGVHGIVCYFVASAPPETPGSGDWSIVERVRIRGPQTAGEIAHGVVMNGRMSLRDVHIIGFTGDGIHIRASAAETPQANANNWQIQNCRVDSCDNGLFVHGGDTNVGCAIALDCSDNRGWGVNDESFLGNTYVACHTAANLNGAYRCPGANTRSLFLNCYSEDGQPLSEINAPSVVLGGIMAVTGTAIWLNASLGIATYANSLRALSAYAPGQPRVAAHVGSGTPGVALELHHFAAEGDSDPIPYRLYYGYLNPGWWELVFANLNVAPPLRFSSEEAPEGHSQLWLEGGYLIGGGDDRIRVTTGHAPPVSGTWKQGDRILNSNPLPGDDLQGYEGWICTAAGSPGTWNGYGRIV